MLFFFFFFCILFLLAGDVGIKVLFKRLRKENLKDVSHSSKNLEYALSK